MYVSSIDACLTLINEWAVSVRVLVCTASKDCLCIPSDLRRTNAYTLTFIPIEKGKGKGKREKKE